MNRLSILMAATALGTTSAGGVASAQSAADLLRDAPCAALQSLRDAPGDAGSLAALVPLLPEADPSASLDDDACRAQIAAAAEAAGVTLPEVGAPMEEAAPVVTTEQAPVETPAPEAETASTEATQDAAPEAEAAAPDTDAQAEAPAQSEAEAPEAEAAVEEQAEAPVEAAPVEAEAAAPETVAELPPATEATAPEAEAEAETAADAPVAAETETATDAPEAAETTAEAAPIEVVQEDTEASTESANEIAVSDAASAPDTLPAEAEMTTEVVTEAETRRSDEDFTSRVTATAPGATSSSGGLSSFEKFALGALGIGVAAAILNQNDEVVATGDDRAVVRRDDGNLYVLKDDNALLRQPGTEVRTETFDDGSVRQFTTRPDGSQVITVRAADGQVLRRVKVLPDGTRVTLFDDTLDVAPVALDQLPGTVTQGTDLTTMEVDELRLALLGQEVRGLDRRFTLQQIRNIRAVRSLVPVLELDAVTFDSGSAAVRATEAEELRALGIAMRGAIEESPGEVFLIEGHTDATGSAAMNLALSDRRAESVALALTEYFDVPPENMVIQGYGESALKIRTSEAERANRRVTVRRITPLLYMAAN